MARGEDMSDSDRAPVDVKRRRILEAAMEICEARGVHAARMEEVAALAQVSKGTLYRYFESKEDLFLASLIGSYEEGLQAVEVPESAAPTEQLRHLLRGLGRVLMQVAPRARVLYQAWGVVADSPAFSERLNDFLRSFHRERHAEFEALVEAGQAAGEFRTDVSADTVAHMIGALLSGFIYRGAFDSEATPEALAACFDTLCRHVLAVPGAARPTREVDR